MKKKIFGPILLATLFILIIIAGIISYQSIDWTVLNRLEDQELILPTPIITNLNISTSPISPTNNP
jgi:hypothetical protein